MLTLNDVASLKDRLNPMTIDADKLLNTVREYAKQFPSYATPVNALVGLTDVRCVHHVFRKPDEARGVFRSLVEIGFRFVQEPSSITLTPVVSPWIVHTQQEVTSSMPSSVAAGVIGCSETGNVENTMELLEQEGFTKGMMATRKTDGATFKF